MERINIKIFKYFSILFIIPLASYTIPLPLLYAQDYTSSGSGLHYYFQLKQEKFLQTMLTKERYLFALVDGAKEEIYARRRKGEPVSDLGIREIMSSQEIIVDEYEKEIQKIVQLMDQIKLLEREAKRKVDLRVLKALVNLKKDVWEIINVEHFQNADNKLLGGYQSPDLQKQGSENLQIGAAGSTTRDSIRTRAEFDDLFEQWKYNRILDYNVKLTEYQFLRTRLLKTASPLQERRMFQRDLKIALENYSVGDFSLSRLQLRNVLNTYSHYQDMEDVLYYCGESSYGLNFLDEAMDAYKRLVMEYHGSPFRAKALVKMIYIYYIYDKFDRLFDVYDQLIVQKSDLDSESFTTVAYLVGYAHFKQGNYSRALKAMINISPGTSYFYPFLYLSGACYSNLGDDGSALSIYLRLIKEKNKGKVDPVLEQIQNNALLKLGLIYYELGDNQQAMYYFNQVSDNYKHYDLSLIGKAWSAYRAGKPGLALRDVEKVLRQSTMSSYSYEARVLAATSKELLGYSDEAIKDLKKVYDVKNKGDQIDRYSSQSLVSVQRSQETGEPGYSVVEGWDSELFNEINQIRSFLQKYSGISGMYESGQEQSEPGLSESIDRLEQKIETMDKLERQAREGGADSQLEEIRKLRSDLIQALDENTIRSSFNGSMSSQDPLIQRMGMSEYLKYLFRSLLSQTLRGKEKTRKDIERTEKLLEEAKSQDQFHLRVKIEITQDELHDYYGRLNQYEVWLRENFPMEFRVELDKWVSFSGYGISNINFQRIKEGDQRIARISQSIVSLDRVFSFKRKQLENRIQGLLADVATIESQMRLEAEQRQQKEMDKFFKSEYFNKQQREPNVGEIQEKPEINGEGNK